MFFTFWMLLVVIFLGGVAALIFAGAVRLLTRREPLESPHEAVVHGRHGWGAGILASMLLTGLLAVGFLVVGSWVSLRRVESATASAQVVTESTVAPVAISLPRLEGADPLPRSETVGTEPSGSEVVPVADTTEVPVPQPGDKTEPASERSETAVADEGRETDPLPEWTAVPEKTLADGHVPTVRRVIRSGLYATEEEARHVAYAKVESDLRSRLASSYPALAGWKIPHQTLMAHSIRENHVEVRDMKFGEFQEPMYQVWVQYEDSPHVREPIIAEWNRSAVGGRTILIAAGAGIVALLLGAVSAGFRTLIAPPGHRGRPALAAAVLGVGTGVAAAVLLIG